MKINYSKFLFLKKKYLLNVLMKTSLCISFFVLVGFTTKAVYAQNSKVVIDSNKTISIEEVFDILKQQTDHTFIYSVDLFKGKPKVALKKEVTTVGKLLNLSVEKLGYTVDYKEDGTISIFPPLLKTSVSVSQVQMKITGTVTDASNMPVPGVTVMEENTTNGTVTDFDGIFSINVASKESTLVFSYMGMVTVKKKVGDTTDMKVEMIGDTEALEEIVIVGYGTQKRSEITGSISNVKGESVSEVPVQSFESALNGRATGVNITANAGVLNQAPVFRIRGTNSLSLSSYPLVVVDGVPMFTSETESGLGYAATNPLSAINPADIESIDIAKDAAATSIYGSRAANGVVFVTTKKGKLGSARVSYDGWVGFTTANNLPNVLNAAEYIEIKNEGLLNEGTFNATNNYYDYSLDNNGNKIDTNWSDHIYQTGVSFNHNINISGATDKTRYYGSIGYTEQEGIFQENSFDRKSALFNIDNKTTDWLEIGAKITYVNENNASAMATGTAGSETATGVMARLALMTAPIASPFNNDGTFNNTSSGFVGLQDNASHLKQSRLGFTNPVLSMKYNYSNNNIDHILSNAYVVIKPTSWISFRSLFGVDYRNTTYNIYYSPLTNEGRSSNGTANSAHNSRDKWVWTNTINVEKVFGDHSFNLLLGEEEQKTDGDQFGLSRTGQTDPLYSNIQGGWQNVFDWNTDNQVYDNYLFSLFGRLQYNYKQKYFFTANARQDEYSALGLNNKKGNFWGLSAGWEITKENFWTDSGLNDVFSAFKLRASYGKVGNIGGLGDFAAINTYSATLYGGQPGLVYSSTGNPDLEWETSKKTEIGINFGFFQNRLTAELAYYNNDIDGLIFGVPLPPSAGVPNGTINTVLQNVGTMYNRGVEFSVGGTPILNDDFSWNSSLNISTNKNEVTSLADGVPSIITGYSITLPGQPLGMINAVRTAGIDPATGRRIFLDQNGTKVFYQHVVGANSPSNYKWSYEDGSAAPPITPATDAVPFKNTAPKVYGGFNNTFKYKAFELDVLMTYQLGGNLYNGTQATMRDQRFWNNSRDVLRRWQNPGDVTDIARIVNGDNVSMGNTMAIDANISSSDFLRLKTLMLSYTIPKDLVAKINLSNVKVYASGQNLAIWTNYTGMDPEVTTNANNPMSQGIDRNQAPNARTITLGMKVNF